MAGVEETPGHQAYQVNHGLLGHSRVHSSHKFAGDADEPDTEHSWNFFFSFLVLVIELRALVHARQVF